MIHRLPDDMAARLTSTDRTPSVEAETIRYVPKRFLAKVGKYLASKYAGPDFEGWQIECDGYTTYYFISDVELSRRQQTIEQYLTELEMLRINTSWTYEDAYNIISAKIYNDAFC